MSDRVCVHGLPGCGCDLGEGLPWADERCGPDARHGLVAACLGGTGCAAVPIRGRLARDIMATPAVTVREDASTLEILDVFSTNGINRVPVIDGSGRLAGIVSRADILRARSAPPE